MVCKRIMVMCIGICAIGSISASRCVRLALQIDSDKSYVVSLEPTTSELRLFSHVNNSIVSATHNNTVIRDFFQDDFKKFSYDSKNNNAVGNDKKPIVPSFIENLSELDAQAILKRQSYMTQMQHYVVQAFTKTDTIHKAQSILKTALKNFDTTIRTQCVDFYSCDNKKTIIDVAIDLDDEKPLLIPYFRGIYNAIKSLGLVLGFEIPIPEQAWYMRHKGKIALGVGTGLTLLAIAKYTNLLGNKSIPPSIQSQPQPAPVHMESIPDKPWYSKYTRTTTETRAQKSIPSAPATASIGVQPPSSAPWYSDPIGAAKAQVNTFIQAMGKEGSKQVSKAMVAKLAEHHGISQPPVSPGVKDIATDMAAREVIKVLAQAYDLKVVSNTGPGSDISGNVSPSVISVPTPSPSLMGNVRSWFENSISSAANTVRSGVTKTILSPEGGDVAGSYFRWK